MCAHLAISAASEATGAMSGVCAVAVGALAGLIGLKVSFAAPPRAPKKRQPRNGVTERERPRCFCEPLGAEPMSIRSRLPRASVAKGPPGISFHSSGAADHLNCSRILESIDAACRPCRPHRGVLRPIERLPWPRPWREGACGSPARRWTDPVALRLRNP